MIRTTVYNKLTDKKDIEDINKENIGLMNEFLDYLESVDRSEKTIYQYEKDLNIFFVWNLKNNNNKFFVDIKKRDFIKFQKTALNEYKWSPARIKRVKSCISSLSNYVESFLDDEFEDYRSVIKKIESPVNEKVRDKSIIPDDKIELLLNTLTREKRYEQACAIAVAAYSGMRKAELLLMKDEYFDDNHIVYDGAMYMTDKIRTKGRGKQGKQLNKYILIGAKPYIDNWINYKKDNGLNSEWLFVFKENGTVHKRKSLDFWNKHMSEIIGMPFYWHSLRHYLTSRLIRMNIPEEVIKEFNGWSDISLVSYYNDNDLKESFGKYFSKDGVIKQEKKNLFD